MVHNVALVLGGGGAAGNAWLIGIIAGLAEAGVDMTEAADLVVGTSAGATAAAQVRSGIPAAELLASVLSPPIQPVGQNRERPPSLRRVPPQEPGCAALSRRPNCCPGSYPRRFNRSDRTGNGRRPCRWPQCS